MAQVCVDHRRIDARPATGAAQYAQGLRSAVAASDRTLVELSDLAPSGEGERSRGRRRLAAANPFPARLGRDGAVLHAPDLFRRAQVRFDLFGGFLPLRTSAPPEIMHWSYPLPMRLQGAVNVYSVLDLIPVLRPDLSPVPRARMLAILNGLDPRRDFVTTISEASRQEIIEHLGFPAERVFNTYLSVDLARGRADALDGAAVHRLDLRPRAYLLHVGVVERRKNIGRLVAAHRRSGVALPLVLAGPKGWGAEDELTGVGDGAPGSRVVCTGWLPRGDVLALMAGALATLQPSLAEGFGLPVVEAMALGAPVLTSRGGALEEVAGNAALLVDPMDVDAMAEAIGRLAGEEALRARLVSAGRMRAADFSADAYAGRLADAYRAVEALAG